MQCGINLDVENKDAIVLRATISLWLAVLTRQISLICILTKIISEFYAFTWEDNGAGHVGIFSVFDVELAISLQL